jgi:nucleotide-binding universal stress UspA family protein
MRWPGDRPTRILGAPGGGQHIRARPHRRTRPAGWEIETRQLGGEPARHILTEARGWPADLIVIGKSGGRQLGEPYVGSQTAHVLEFADRPVLVVPPPVR